jgi:hypothetical protein
VLKLSLPLANQARSLPVAKPNVPLAYRVTSRYRGLRVLQSMANSDSYRVECQVRNSMDVLPIPEDVRQKGLRGRLRESARILIFCVFCAAVPFGACPHGLKPILPADEGEIVGRKV